LPAPRFPFGKRLISIGALLFALGAIAGCRHRLTVPPPSVPSPPPPISLHWTEQGIASWYGVPFNGNRAADGEIYNMYAMVAAHRTLPFNSLVQVTDLENGRQVVVRIIDRGPFVEHRIIDLSFAAAHALNMVGPGIAPVRLELLSGGNPAIGEFSVQVGAFAILANAERLRLRLDGRWGPVFIQEYDSPRGLLYRVRVGELQGEAAANRLAEQLRRQERFQATFVVRLDSTSSLP
jgi:peptidoglycan lytic transglycosylase